MDVMELVGREGLLESDKPVTAETEYRLLPGDGEVRAWQRKGQCYSHNL